jgi:oligoendopeptidase F
MPITPSLLKQEYRALNEAYFGPDLVIDTEIDIEWARIPHFYYNFYVYQYATGISAALALAEKVLHGGESAREKYLAFLSAGSSRYPLDVLNLAGVDMRTPAPVEAAMKHFGKLVTELEQLLG